MFTGHNFIRFFRPFCALQTNQVVIETDGFAEKCEVFLNPYTLLRRKSSLQKL